jgi:hypothetical protein
MTIWLYIILGLLVMLFLYYFIKYNITFSLCVENQIKMNGYEDVIKEKDRILDEAKSYLDNYVMIKAENKERQAYIDNANKILLDNKYLVERLLTYIIQKNYKGSPDDYAKKYNNQILNAENIEELLEYIDNSGQNKSKKSKKSPSVFLDDILDKVKNEGYDSLNDEEKKFLNNFDKK